jgi:hypothetical protein
MVKASPHVVELDVRTWRPPLTMSFFTSKIFPWLKRTYSALSSIFKLVSK